MDNLTSQRITALIFICLATISFTGYAQVGKEGRGCESATDDEKSGIYLGGFVRKYVNQDGKESFPGVGNAIITATHEGRWLYDLRTTETGWYEATQPLSAACYVGKNISFTILKSGFEIVNKDFLLKNGRNNLDIIMKPVLRNAARYESYLDFPTRTFYGHAIDGSKKILPGVRASLIVDNEEISVGYSRDSGYFSLNYADKFNGQIGQLLVEKFSYKPFKSDIPFIISQNLPLQKIELPFQAPTKWAIALRYSYTNVDIDSQNDLIENYLGVAFSIDYFPSATTEDEFSNPTRLRDIDKKNIFFSLGVGVAFPDRKLPKTPGGSVNTSNYEYTVGVGHRLTDRINILVSLSLLKEDGQWIKGLNLGISMPLRFF